MNNLYAKMTAVPSVIVYENILFNLHEQDAAKLRERGVTRAQEIRKWEARARALALIIG